MTVTVAVCLGGTGWAAAGGERELGQSTKALSVQGGAGSVLLRLGGPSGLGGGREAGREVPWWVRGLRGLACGVGGRGVRQKKARSGWRRPTLGAVGAHRGVKTGKGRQSMRVGLRPPRAGEVTQTCWRGALSVNV